MRLAALVEHIAVLYLYRWWCEWLLVPPCVQQLQRACIFTVQEISAPLNYLWKVLLKFSAICEHIDGFSCTLIFWQFIIPGTEDKLFVPYIYATVIAYCPLENCPTQQVSMACPLSTWQPFLQCPGCLAELCHEPSWVELQCNAGMSGWALPPTIVGGITMPVGWGS